MSEARLTKRQAAIIGAYTGFTAGPFGDVHEYINEIMGRPVWTHEMASEALAEEVREKAKPDFLAICSVSQPPPTHNPDRKEAGE